MTSFLRTLLRDCQSLRTPRRHVHKRRTRQSAAAMHSAWRDAEQLESRLYLSAVSGTVFDDADGNGVQDPGEVGLVGVEVYLDSNDNEVLDDGETSTLSGPDGRWEISGLAAGDLTVRQVVPAGYQQTSPVAADARLFATTFFGTHRVQELDPADGSVINEFALPNPQANFGFQGLGFDGRTLFYYENNEKVLYELDPDTGAVQDSTSLASLFANRNIGGLAAGNGRVYLLDATSVTAAPALLVFNPQSNQVTDTFSLAGLNVDEGLAYLSSENLVVVPTVQDEFKLINPTTGAVQETVPFTATFSNSTVTGLAVIGNEFYLTAGGRITDVIARNGSLVRTFINPVESGGLAAGPAQAGAWHVTVDGTTDRSGLNFGNRNTGGTISGTKYLDRDGDGIRDPGEPGLAGVTIYLDTNRNGQPDQGELQTTTAADGSYAFENLEAGIYNVREVVAAGYRQTSQGNDPGTFYGAAYVADSGGQMNYVEIDGLTGQVNRIGPLLPDRIHGLARTRTGEIYGLNGRNADSIYRIEPGTGQATLVGTTGYEMTFGLAYDPVTDTLYGVGKPSETDTTNFLLTIDRSTGAVTPVGPGYVGLVATSDLAFDPVTRRVVAFDNNDDEIVAFELDGTATQLADFSGINTFSITYTPDGLVYGGIGTTADPNDIDPRNTLRSLDLSTGDQSTYLVLSEAAPLEAVDWNNDPGLYRFQLGVGQIVSDVDFGNQVAATGELRGVKFNDLNGDGIRQSTELGLAGVTIYLDANHNSELDAGETFTLTGPDGQYAFTGLEPDSYTVREVVPEGFRQTSPSGDSFYYATTRGHELVRIDADTGLVTTIGPHQAGEPLHGLIRTNDGRLYAVAGAGSGDSFYSVDPGTGQATRVGSTVLEVGFGLAYDAATDTIYGIGQIGSGRGLVTYDRTTGAATPVAPFGMTEPSGTSGIAFDDVNNRVLVYNFFDGNIFQFDPQTGAGSILVQAGSRLGVNAAFVDGQFVIKQDFNGPNDRLFAVDLTNGSLTPILNLSWGFVAESLEYVPGTDAWQVSLEVGQIIDQLNFGNQSVFGELHGTKFEDRDGDGVRDPDEGPLAGVTIYLDLNDDGVHDTGTAVEPDDFPNRARLNDAVPGVTLTSIGAFGGPIFGGLVQAYGHGDASTGSQVIANASSIWSANNRLLKIDFDQPVSNVSIDYISPFTLSSGRLDVFDAAGNLLESYVTADLSSDAVENMSIVRPNADIAYAIASPDTAFGLLDNLRFGNPEPSTVTDADGNYSFTRLEPGQYVVREVVPEGFQQTDTFAGQTRLFTTYLTSDPDMIQELNPETGAVLNSFEAPVNFHTGAHGLAFDGVTLYFVDFISDRIYQLDPDNGTIRSQTQLPPGNYDGVAAVDGLVYILEFGREDILVFDPDTDSVIRTLDINGTNPGVNLAGGLGEFRGQVLAGTTSTEILFLDPATGAITDRLDHGVPTFDSGLAGSANEIFVGFAISQYGIRVYDRAGNFLRNLNPSPGSFGLAAHSIRDDAHRVRLAPGQIVTGLDFGNQSIFGELHGTKFEDLDGDGVRDDGEGPLAGVTIYLDLNHNGRRETGGALEPDDFQVGAALNDAVPGVTLTAVNRFGSPLFGGQVKVHASPDASTGNQVIGNLSPTWFDGSRLLKLDFEQPVTQITLDYISQFPNSNGKLEAYDSSGNLLATYSTANLPRGAAETMSISRDTAEIAYAIASPGFAIGLLDNLRFGNPEPFTVTDADGNYSFTGLVAGDYTVREVVPEGYVQTSPGNETFYYATTRGSRELLRIDADTGLVTTIGPTLAGRDLHGLVRTNDGQLFAVGGSFTGDDAFYSLDPATGQATRIGATVLPVGFGLAYDSANDTIYGVAEDTSTRGRGLVTFDRTTGEATPVAPLTMDAPTRTSGIAFDDVNNRVLVYNFADGNIFQFDPQTGAGSILVQTQASLGLNATFVDGQLVIKRDFGGPNNQLLTVDLTDGSLTPLLTTSTGFTGESLEYVSILNDAWHVTVAPGQVLTDLDFGNQPLPSELQGTKFEDIDGDGIRDDGEGPLPGVTIYLDLNNNGVRDTGGALEPDDFSNREPLNDAVPGVTLTAINRFGGPIFGGLVQAFGHGDASTGTQVIGNVSPTWFANGRLLKIDFDQPVTSVSIDYISQFSNNKGKLEVYDADGNLLDTYLTASLDRDAVENMSITRGSADIAYAIASPDSTFGLLDNLRFGNPEPFTVTDTEGNYSFTGLQAGDYTVREVVPEGYVQTSPGNETFYYATSRGAQELLRIDADTGAVTVIGPHLIGRELHGLVRTNDGDLFAVGGSFNGDDAFYSINPDTGQATRIGATVLPVGFGLAYDSATDTIYGVAEDTSTRGRGLVTFDRTTGEAIPVAPLTMDAPTRTSGIAFDDVNNRVLVYNFADGNIFQFDPQTGAGSILVQTQASLGLNATFVDGQLVIKRDFGGPNNQLLTVDLTDGSLTPLLTTSIGFTGESLEYVSIHNDAWHVSVGPGQILTGLNFGNQLLNRPPVADANGPYVINEGDPLTLDASGSTDPDGDLLTFTWDLDNDGQFDDATGATPSLSWNDLLALGLDDDGTYPVRVRVSDAEFSDVAASTLTIENVAPRISALVLDSTVIDENGTVQLTGTFIDPGTRDTHEVQINWGDGSAVVTVPLQAGERTFSVTHTYLDDNPTATPSDQYTIGVAVTDDDGGSDDSETSITVRNVAPELTSLSTTAGTVGQQTPADTVVLTGTFADQGLQDTHSAIVHWGDGSSSTAQITQGSGSGALSATHHYTSGGIFEIIVTVTDDDTGSDTGTTIAFVTGVRISAAGELQIVGTSADDHVTVNQQGKGTVKIHGKSILPGGKHLTLPSDEVRSVVAFLGAGDDHLQLAGNIDWPVIAVGSDGDDKLNAGRGPALLIGGSGRDDLQGGHSQDILIGGSTSFDSDPLALRAIMDEWTSDRTLQQRVANLIDGSGSSSRRNGSNFLTVGNGGTVSEDADKDKLKGGSDLDWFFFEPSRDKASDLKDELFANELDDLLTL